MNGAERIAAAEKQITEVIRRLVPAMLGMQIRQQEAICEIIKALGPVTSPKLTALQAEYCNEQVLSQLRELNESLRSLSEAEKIVKAAEKVQGTDTPS